MKPAEKLHNVFFKHVIISGCRIHARDHDIIPAAFDPLRVMPEDLPDPSLKKMTLDAVAVLFTDGDSQTRFLQVIIQHIKYDPAVRCRSSLVVDRPEILILFQ